MNIKVLAIFIAFALVACAASPTAISSQNMETGKIKHVF